MKKLIRMMAVLSIVTNHSFAQSNFSITAGAVYSNYSAKAEGETANLDAKIGLTAGVTATIPIGKSFGFQPSVNYVQKGAQLNDQGNKMTITLHYLEVPLNFIYNTPGKKDHFYFGVGPYVAYGIAAKIKEMGIEMKANFGDAPQDVAKPLEIGANVVAGYQWGKLITFSANYNQGLNNISSDGSSTEHNYYFGLRVGYIINGKK